MKQQLLVLILAAVIASVAGESKAQSKGDLAFVELHTGLYVPAGRITKKQAKVISSQADYASELGVYTTAAPAAVDFTIGKVLLVDMGLRNTGGYSIAVTSVNSGRNSVTANVRLTKPSADCITTQAFTNPYQFVFIPSLKEILVSETVTITRCSED